MLYYTAKGGDDVMSISYNKLWKKLIDQSMNKTQLRCAAHISTNAMAKLSRNESVSIETISKICAVLDCDIGDIMQVHADNNAESRD